MSNSCQQTQIPCPLCRTPFTRKCSSCNTVDESLTARNNRGQNTDIPSYTHECPTGQCNKVYCKNCSEFSVQCPNPTCNSFRGFVYPNNALHANNYIAGILNKDQLIASPEQQQPGPSIYNNLQTLAETCRQLDSMYTPIITRILKMCNDDNIRTKNIGHYLMMVNNAWIFDNQSDDTFTRIQDPDEPIKERTIRIFADRMEMFNNYRWRELDENFRRRNENATERIRSRFVTNQHRNTGNTRPPATNERINKRVEKSIENKNLSGARKILENEEVSKGVSPVQINNFLPSASLGNATSTRPLNEQPIINFSWRTFAKIMDQTKIGNSRTPNGSNIDFLLRAWNFDASSLGSNHNSADALNPETQLQQQMYTFIHNCVNDLIPPFFFNNFLNITKIKPIIKKDENNNPILIPGTNENKLRIVCPVNNLKKIADRCAKYANQKERITKAEAVGQMGLSPNGPEILVHGVDVWLQTAKQELIAQARERDRMISQGLNPTIDPNTVLRFERIFENAKLNFPNCDWSTNSELDRTIKMIRLVIQAAINNRDSEEYQNLLTTAIQAMGSENVPEFIKQGTLNVNDLKEKGILGNDLKKAHTSFGRKLAREASLLAEPELERTWNQNTTNTSHMIVPCQNGECRIVPQTDGGKQGDTMTGIAFKNLIGPIIDKITKATETESLSIEDDITNYGDVLQLVFTFILNRHAFLTEANLEASARKSFTASPFIEFSPIFEMCMKCILNNSPKPKCIDPDEGFYLCGRWFSCDRSSGWANEKLERQLNDILEKTEQLEKLDSEQKRLALLRNCDNARGLHLPRLYPPTFEVRTLFHNFDNSMRDVITNITGIRNDANILETRANLPIRHGGLGVLSLYQDATLIWATSFCAAIKNGVKACPSIHAIFTGYNYTTRVPELEEAYAITRTSRITTVLKQDPLIFGKHLATALEDIHSAKLKKSPDQIRYRGHHHFDTFRYPPLTPKEKKITPPINGSGLINWLGQRGALRTQRKSIGNRRKSAIKQSLSDDGRILFEDSLDKGHIKAISSPGSGRHNLSNKAFRNMINNHLNRPDHDFTQHYPLLANLGRENFQLQIPNPNQHDNIIPNAPIECNNPQCNHPMDTHGQHATKCKKANKNIIHEKTAECVQNLFTYTCGLQSKVITAREHLEDIMCSGCPEDYRNNIGDAIFTFDNQQYMIDYSITSNGRVPEASRRQGHTLTSMQSAIKKREDEKKRKYRYLDTNRFAGFIPVIFGTNGSFGKEAKKFFQMMEDDMVANGRIPRWKFKAYFLPEVIVAIYRGLTMAQEDYYNKCRMATNLIGARAAHRIDSNQDASNSSSHYN